MSNFANRLWQFCGSCWRAHHSKVRSSSMYCGRSDGMFGSCFCRGGRKRREMRWLVTGDSTPRITRLNRKTCIPVMCKHHSQPSLWHCLVTEMIHNMCSHRLSSDTLRNLPQAYRRQFVSPACCPIAAAASWSSDRAVTSPCWKSASRTSPARQVGDCRRECSRQCR